MGQEELKGFNWIDEQGMNVSSYFGELKRKLKVLFIFQVMRRNYHLKKRLNKELAQRFGQLLLQN
jgi:hypothetical protein